MKRPPKPHKPWRKVSVNKASRFKYRRALYRAEKNPAVYRKFAKWVRRIRKQFDKNQEEFAKIVGVGVATIRRWEGAIGMMPSPQNTERLTKLYDLSQTLRREGTKFE